MGADNYEDIKNYKNIDKVNYIYEINDSILSCETFDFSNQSSKIMFEILALVLAVIVVTSIYCIKNSFSISVSEKLKTYGMLSSIGATKKQIRKSVKNEAMLLASIGIPIGVLFGIVIVWALVKLSNLILAQYLDELMPVSDVYFAIKISIPAILLSIILSLVTVYLSAYSSARKAGKVAPVELMRNSQKIKISKKSLKVPAPVSKIFKIGGVIAYKNLKRNKKKYKTTVVSITISIILFISMGTFGALISGMFDGLKQIASTDYNIQVVSGQDDTQILNLSEDQIKRISSLKDVEEKYMLYESESIKITDESKISDAAKEKMGVNMSSNIGVYALDSSSFEKYAEKVHADYKSVKNKAILIDNIKSFKQNDNSSENNNLNYEIGDEIEGTCGENSVSIPIGARANVLPYGREIGVGSYLVVDINEFDNLKFDLVSIAIKTNDADGVQTAIERIAPNVHVNGDDQGMFEIMEAMQLVVDVFKYSFLAIVVLIGVTNIFNVLASSIELRRREFAVLKSIGMTKKEFNKMINLETLFYGTKSLIIGVFVGLIISGIFNMLFKLVGIFLGVQSYNPIKEIVICIVAVYALIFTIMRCSIRKINKKNIIETIREDNI